MRRLKFILPLLLTTLSLFVTEGFAETFTSCFKNACVIITAPDHVAPGEEYELQVEGYIENATSWDVSAYMLLENAEWNYDSDHLIHYSGQKLDAKGFNWGGSIIKKYKLKDLAETKVFTFVFGSRSWSHGYYDVAVDATVEVAAPGVDVAFDVKPQSCPNPLNMNKKGLLSAAIVGSSDLDVRQVDPATIQLAGVHPLHFSYEDVTAPFYPLTGKMSEHDCTDSGPDGFLDLTLKFRAQDVYSALQSLHGRPLLKGDTLNLQLTAVLSGESGQKLKVAISGEDVIRINTKK